MVDHSIIRNKEKVALNKMPFLPHDTFLLVYILLYNTEHTTIKIRVLLYLRNLFENLDYLNFYMS
jgi:hypothetical protein